MLKPMDFTFDGSRGPLLVHEVRTWCCQACQCQHAAASNARSRSSQSQEPRSYLCDRAHTRFTSP